MTIRTRFAPSPTGFMHVGNLRTCLYAYYYAKKNNGQFILRIEDTDQGRLVDGAVDVIYSTLQKAGVIHDEGPDKDGGVGPYIQSERKDIYFKYAHKLVELGGAYYCFCDKERVDSLADDKGIKRYDKHCLHLSKDEIAQKLKDGVPYVIRQNIPTLGVSAYDDMVFGHISVPNSDMEDGVLLKSDGMPTYNFANVIDDHLMNITTVIRGVEYLSSTPKYNLIYQSFGWELPQYMHLPPIMKDEHRKLSKRFGDANFEDFIQKGFLVPAIINYISLLGWAPQDNREKLTMDELIQAFEVSGVSKSSAILDEVKMRWLNSEYIKAMTVEEFLAVATPYLDASKIGGKYDYRKLAKLLIPRVEILGDIAVKVNFLEEYDDYSLELYTNKKNKTDESVCLNLLQLALPALIQLQDWTEEGLQACIADIVERHQIKKAQVYLALRVALSGAQVTPGGATELADLLGKDECIRRIQYSVDRIQLAFTQACHSMQ